MLQAWWKWLGESSWKWLRENVFKAIILAALTTSIVAWLKGTFDTILRESLPSGASISCIGREWVIDRRPFRQPEPTKEVFRILDATLDHDDANRTLSEAVVGAFQGEKGIEAIETYRVLKIEGAGERIEEAAAKRGQEWLSWRDAESTTSAWRRSISSTRKTSEHPRSGYNLLEEAVAAAAADMVAAAADTAAAVVADDGETCGCEFSNQGHAIDLLIKRK